jgi:hypothetical protein
MEIKTEKEHLTAIKLEVAELKEYCSNDAIIKYLIQQLALAKYSRERQTQILQEITNLPF